MSRTTIDTKNVFGVRLGSEIKTASEEELEQSVVACEDVTKWCGIAVVLGVAIEAVIAGWHPSVDSVWDRWGGVFANGIVALGVAGEVLLGRIGKRRQDELTLRAKIHLAEATRLAGQAVERASKTDMARVELEKAIAPRTLEQLKTGKMLSEFDQCQVVLDSLSDHEPRRTAGMIRTMLLVEAHWKEFSAPLTRTWAFFDGVVIHTSIHSRARIGADALVSVLNDAGIETRPGYPIEELGQYGVLVIVGPKPFFNGRQESRSRT